MKGKITKIIYAIPAVILALPSLVNATTPVGPSFTNPIGFKTFEDVVAAITGVVTQVGTVLVVLAIIYAGFLFVSAKGSEDKISKAKATFMWVVVGAIIILGAEVLGEVVCETAKEFGSLTC